jgi:hypothetical protein
LSWGFAYGKGGIAFLEYLKISLDFSTFGYRLADLVLGCLVNGKWRASWDLLASLGFKRVLYS